MTTAQEYVFIINKHAGNGRMGRRWQEIEQILKNHITDYIVKETRGRGHATDLCREAIDAGSKNIIAVGGDGTISEVASGFFNENGKPLATKSNLGILPAGSGSDFSRTINMPHDYDEAIEILKKAKTRTIDAGIVSFTDYQGIAQKRPFINIAEVGIGGEVIEILEKRGKGLGSWLSYQLATIEGLIKFELKDMQITIDGNPLEGKYAGVIVANGQYFGSGMKIAPHAILDDGLFDVVIIGSGSKFDMLLKMPKVRDGSHIEDDAIQVIRAKEVKVTAHQRALLDIDGEQPGDCPAEFSLVEKAVSVIVP